MQLFEEEEMVVGDSFLGDKRRCYTMQTPGGSLLTNSLTTVVTIPCTQRAGDDAKDSATS